jgi:hypothetical protein
MQALHAVSDSPTPTPYGPPPSNTWWKHVQGQQAGIRLRRMRDGLVIWTVGEMGSMNGGLHFSALNISPNLLLLPP